MISCIAFNQSSAQKSRYYTSGFPFWQRSKIEHGCQYASNIVVNNAEQGFHKYQSIQIPDYIIYCLKQPEVSNNYSVCLVTQKDYNGRVAQLACIEISTVNNHHDGNEEKFNELCDKFRDGVDMIEKVTQQLSQVNITMMDNINKMIERGESIDDLVQRTAELEDASSVFFKSAKDMNRCCVIL